jgi:SAM-dependent methyltransferase
MNWRVKALLQQLLSRSPQGERLNHFLQRYVTRSLPTGDASCAIIVAQAREHVRTVARHSRRALEDAVFYEFGAGWDLMIPLAYYGLGVNRQILVDFRPLVRPELVNATIAQFARLRPDLGLFRVPAQPLAGEVTAALALLRERYGMEYRAPADARDTGLPAAGVDCITSTNTLEHIPRDDIARILTECRRILADDGVMSFRIDYQDHFSYFDSRISVYNFLRYSERTWTWYNPSLHYQNRLRHSDYMQLIRNAGFEIIEEHRTDPSDADRALLGTLPVDQRFRHYEQPDLGVRGALLVVRKRNGINASKR